MAELSVKQIGDEDQLVGDGDWEEEVYREGCDRARDLSKLRFQTLYEELLSKKSDG